VLVVVSLLVTSSLVYNTPTCVSVVTSMVNMERLKIPNVAASVTAITTDSVGLFGITLSTRLVGRMRTAFVQCFLECFFKQSIFMLSQSIN